MSYPLALQMPKGLCFFIFLDRERGDFIETNCPDSCIYYSFLIDLLISSGHKISNDFFSEYLNSLFKVTIP